MPDLRTHEVVINFSDEELDFLGIKNLSEDEQADFIRGLVEVTFLSGNILKCEEEGKRWTGLIEG